MADILLRNTENGLASDTIGLSREESEEEEQEEDAGAGWAGRRIGGWLPCQSELGPAWDVMSCHPSYLAVFSRTHQRLLGGGGPLPGPARHLLATTAAARLGCAWLAGRHRTSLPPDWAERGLAAAPAKLARLAPLNLTLAHRPWELGADQVAELTRPGRDSWSLSELVAAIVILAHSHAFSSLVQSCVVMEEAGQGGEGAHCTPAPHPPSIPGLLQKMEDLRGRQQSPPPREELTTRFHAVTSQQGEEGAGRVDLPSIQPDFTPFLLDMEQQYQDFAPRGRQSEFPTFRVQDFSWDEEGYSMVARFDEELAQLLDDKFRTIYNLTYGTMGGHSSIDTSLFRRASWNYIQCLWGIRHDDYDYHEVNELLDRDLKNYIKKASCYPIKCTKQEYDSIMEDFQPSEKVHLLMLVGEAKLQSSLLYAMRAVSEHFNRS